MRCWRLPCWLVLLPWLLMYVTCLHLYYAADPEGRQGSVPYISGMLGDRKDTVPPAGTAGENRMTAWSIAIGVTVLARVAAYWSVGQLQLILKWMALYTVIFELTVITAFWDAHESFNPFHKWVKGSTLHFALSLAFFTVGGTESFELNLVRLFPQRRAQMKRIMIEYISVYCLMFVVEKLDSKLSWLGHAFLPIMEHVMLFSHVGSDCAGLALLLKPASETRDVLRTKHTDNIIVSSTSSPSMLEEDKPSVVSIKTEALELPTVS